MSDKPQPPPDKVFFDEAEAMVRFIEGFAGIERASLNPAIDARDALDAIGQAIPAAELRSIKAGVKKVMAYCIEQVEAGLNAKGEIRYVPGSQVPRRRQ
jgi:hypothetical protein